MLLISEQLVNRGNRLRCVVVDPRTLRSRDREGPEFRLLLNDIHRRGIHFESPQGYRSPNTHADVPQLKLWLAELDTGQVAEGEYQVEALFSNDPYLRNGYRRDLYILENSHYEDLVSAVERENFISTEVARPTVQYTVSGTSGGGIGGMGGPGGGTVIEAPSLFDTSWPYGWELLVSYLEAESGLPQIKRITDNGSLGVRGVLTRPLDLIMRRHRLISTDGVPIRTVDWLNYHIARFVADQLFFGGSVSYSLRAKCTVIYKLQGSTPLSQALPFWLIRYLESAKLAGMKNYAWSPGEYEGTLAIDWK